MKRLVVLALLLTALATPKAAADVDDRQLLPGAPQPAVAHGKSTAVDVHVAGSEVAGSSPASMGGALVSGPSTWYRWHPGEAAAGPRLRTALGSHWRGMTVRVCATACVTVRLTDWCLCGHGRVIDLDSRSFARLAPLSQGIVAVQVYVGGHQAHPTPPPTDVSQ